MATGENGKAAPPWPPADFVARKQQILASLDRSPKGSLDAPILDFLTWINAQVAVVTTSSCSGRIAVFLGSSDPSNSKGGEWLLSSHGPVSDAAAAWAIIGKTLHDESTAGTCEGRLITLLLEPFVLHAECADVNIAQLILGAARDVGFRESGISMGRRRVMVQLRTLAVRLEVPLALDGKMLVDKNYFETLISIANSRLAENDARVSRLWQALKVALPTRHGAEGLEESGLPWVLTCSQTMARSVKLALEERGWIDEGRKMQAIQTEDSTCAEAATSIGLPLTAEAAAAFQAMAEDEDEEAAMNLERLPASTTDDVVSSNAAGAAKLNEADSSKAACTDGSASTSKDAGGKKKQRPATVAADLERIWKQRHQLGGVRLLRSNDLPAKSKPTQRGPSGALSSADKTAHERDAIQQAVIHTHAAVSAFLQSSSDATPEEDFRLESLLTELREMGSVQWRGDVALIPRGSLVGSRWDSLNQCALKLSKADDQCNGSTGLWERMREGIQARLLGRQKEIRVDDEVRGGNVEIVAGNGSTWVIVPGPKSVRYSFDVTRCMFSEGNAAEKERVAAWQVSGETVLDMYAGVGFWTLPLLVAGVEKIFSCEWNPDALEGLRRGLELLGCPLASRCEVLPGDNRREEVKIAVDGKCHRVMLGLIPTSRDGFPIAVSALRPTGGILHVHWNAPVDAEDSTAHAIAEEIRQLLEERRGGAWQSSVVAIQRIKNFAPRIRHLRIDIRCEPKRS